MTDQLGFRGRIAIVVPSTNTSCGAVSSIPGRSCVEVRAAYSSHCSSAIAAVTSSTPTVVWSCAKADSSAVSHSVLVSLGMPPV